MSLLDLHDITLRFGDFTALDNVSMAVPAGAAVALLGENGAGKSTLVRVAYGMCRPDSGRILWNGTATRLRDPSSARALGIGMVHQHFTLVPAMTVAENLALASPSGFLTSPSAMRDSALRLMERAGMHVDPDAVASRLPIGLQQRVEILKALSTPTRLLILDEPTAVLAPTEVSDLFAALSRLRDAGTSLVLITHKLPEALALADEVIVLRRGSVALASRRGDVDADALAKAMVGRSLTPPPPLPIVALGPVVAALEPNAFGLDDGHGEIRAGETLGVAGVEGNGQTELAETVAGLRHDAPLLLEADGVMVNASKWSVGRRIEWGMAHIPDDRHATALALTMSVRDNLFLSGDALPHRGPWIDQRRLADSADNLVSTYDVRAPSLSMPVGAVSGGNQQKVVVARELSRSPRLLVAVNPTRGLDVAASEFVHDALRKHRERGGATLLVSSELDELLALSDRIEVMYRGRSVGALRPGADDDREQLGRMMTGAKG